MKKTFYVRIEGFDHIWSIKAYSLREVQTKVDNVVRNNIIDIYGDIPKYHISNIIPN